MVAFYDKKIVDRTTFSFAILSFLLALLCSLIGAFPISKKLQVNNPEEIQSLITQATDGRLAFLRVSSFLFALGIIILSLGVFLSLFCE